ncbi:MAG: Sapep family Mn(2+)-dependent dipeptidase [Oscillospiraceae bacterium]|nr:Sapep family Mn(2+)-dependent dipeptidase [Oscillospiraceae bacterium]
MIQNEKINAWVDSHREELLEDLKTLCRIPSVNGPAAVDAPYGIEAARALTAAEDLCRGYGFTVADHDHRVMTADLGPEEARLDILAHLDVVGPGDGWDTDPFEPVIKPDGYIYGRGVADDKGGAVAALYAMRCIRELGPDLRYRVRLILGTDEECGSSDVAYYYKQQPPAPHTFTPDADFPVCNGEKGFYRLRFKKSWEPVCPAGPYVTALHGGFQMNAVPTQAWAELSGIDPMNLMAGAAPLCAELGASCEVEQTDQGARITVTGRGCHAASPKLGINPNTALIQVLTELPLADDPSTRALCELHKLLPHGDSSGKAIGIAQADERTGALTCAFTIIDISPTGAEGLCDCRIPLCATTANCKDIADNRLSALGYEAAGMMIPPHYTPAEGEFIQTLLGCYEAVTGRPGACYSMGGGTYVHDVPGGVAFGYKMPGVEVNMHGANERFPVEDLLTATKIFAHAIAALCG